MYLNDLTIKRLFNHRQPILNKKHKRDIQRRRKWIMGCEFWRSKNASVEARSERVKGQRNWEIFDRKWCKKRVSGLGHVVLWKRGAWFCLEMDSIWENERDIDRRQEAAMVLGVSICAWGKSVIYRRWMTEHGGLLVLHVLLWLAGETHPGVISNHHDVEKICVDLFYYIILV